MSENRRFELTDSGADLRRPGYHAMNATADSRDLPLVTIAITCFNAENTIGAAIASAAAQEWPHLEIIVADDASSDDSRGIVAELARRDDRIRLICHERNRGYAAALNSIVAAARGEFIAVFDDDDVSAPDRVARQWRRLVDFERASGTRLVFCYSNRNVIVGEEGRAADPVRAIGRAATEPHGTDVVDFLLWHREDPRFVWGQMGSCTLLARRTTLLEVGALDEEFRRGAEWDLAVRMGLMGGRFIAVDESLVTQRKTATQDKAGIIPLTYALRLRRKYRDYFPSRGLYLASRAIARARFHYARGEHVRSRLWLALACACSPQRVLPNELRKWTRRNAPGARTLARNAGFVFALRAAQHPLRLAVLYFVVRALDPTQFGQYQLVLTYVALATVTALPGLNNSVMQSIARGAGGVYRAALRRAFRSSLLGSAALVAAAAHFLHGGRGDVAASFLAAAALFPFAHGLEQWKSARSGAQDFAGVFRVEAATAALFAGLTIAAVTRFPGLVVVPVAVLFGVQALANLQQSRRALARIPAQAPVEDGVLTHGMHMTAYYGLNTLANHADKVLIYMFLSPASLALFVAAERIPELTKNAVQDVAAVLAPRFATRERYDRRLDRNLRAAGMAAGVAIVAAAFTVLPWLVRAVFGEAYAGAVPYAQALMCAVAIGNVSTLRYRFVTSKPDRTSPLIVNVVMSSTRVVASAILVPLFGLAGAVVSAAIYRVAMTVTVHVVIRRRYLNDGGSAP